jgi:hypothetical protein
MANRNYQPQAKVILRQMRKLEHKAVRLLDDQARRAKRLGIKYTREPVVIINRLSKKYEALYRTLRVLQQFPGGLA